MPQISSWTIANSGGSVYRAAVNTALSAIQSSSSGTAAPSPTVAGMLWYDTTNSILKRRNTANTAWVDVNSDTLAATTVRGNSSGSAAAEAAVTMPTLRSMLGFPISGTGLGQWTKIESLLGAALSLPAGGTWAYFIVALNSAGGTVSTGAGVAAGGTTIVGAFAGIIHNGFAWRIA
jgi:hypothetical protein